MRKAKAKKILAYLGLMSLLAALGLSAFLYKSQLSDSFIQESQNKLILLKASEKVWEVWREGVYSELYEEVKKKCPLSRYDNNFRCNSELFNCVISNSSFKTLTKGKGNIAFSRVEKISKKKNGIAFPREGVQLSLKLKKSKITLVLEKSCNKIFLPQRIYGFGEEKNPSEEYRFDNFGKNIFIDKELTPSMGMTKNQMQEACSERGMQLLEGHILDAASFHPVDLKNTKPLNFLNPELPWSRTSKDQFTFKAQKDKEFRFKKEFCDFLYSKECVEYKNESLPSWMGIRNPLGSLVEVSRNIIQPKGILSPSSIYFGIHSEWHRLGVRAQWNGYSFNERDFFFGKWKGPELEDYKKMKTGFRCMQEVWR